MSFHHDMMRALDQGTYQGRPIPRPETHYAMRQALRRANMHGAPIQTPEQLAAATVRELAR